MLSFAWKWVLRPPSGECRYSNIQFVNLMSHLNVHVEPMSGVLDALNVPQAIKKWPAYSVKLWVVIVHQKSVS